MFMLTAVYLLYTKCIFYILICVNAQTFISCDMSFHMSKPSIYHEKRKLTPDYDEGSLEANGLHSDAK
jgi:hypothetical protein